MADTQTFSATVKPGLRGQLWIALPFDPDSVWGKKPRHLIDGTIAGIRFRAAVESMDGEHALIMRQAWVRDNPVRAGDEVDACIWPDGPQRTETAGDGSGIDPDISAALAAEPEAAAFFDGLAQFYRKGYLRWIAATKKRPEERVRRIAEVVSLLKKGVKQR
ncbi:MAG: YdeI/OmpD-associated family protein [Candidatus Methylacidiphilales bacterium]|nr:YdeI/OmpD-associated family protein [Candidatus Methylacidiphilales bacterium]